MRDFDYISQLLGQRELSSAKKISQKEIDQGKQEFEKIRESLHHNASVFLDDEDKYLQMSLFMYDAIIAVNSMFNNRDKGSAININDIKKLLPMMILSYQHRTGHEITSPDTKNETETAQQIRETYEILIQYIKQTQNIWTW
jgi:hypothetical protein